VNSGGTHLIVFTRLPCEGRNKTRLIPALGAAGAADFHDRLARHTVGRASAFCRAHGNVKLVIRLDGGSPRDGMDWLGAHDFREQYGGDLGERLGCAVQDAFSEGAGRVLVIGTDCPELDHATLAAALNLLDHHPLVFGPAVDGGYYLVGLSAPSPIIFRNIAWGGAEVLAQSLAAAGKAGLSAGLLHPLPDVDVPEDLPAAEIALAAGCII
jgi:rSAM/selenodomain-associated transferase 1